MNRFRRDSLAIGIAAFVTAIIPLRLSFYEAGTIRQQDRRDSIDAGAGVLRQARAAVGGDRLQSLLLSGAAAEGHNAVTGDLAPAGTAELKFLPPDKFLRTDRGVVRGIDRQDGFNGSQSLYDWTKAGTGVAASTTQPEASAYVKRWRLEVARLMLGIAAVDEPALVRWQAVIGKPGRQSVDFVDGVENLATLDLDPDTHLPLRVRYKDRLPFPHPLRPEERGKGIVPLPPTPEDTEVVLDFDRRERVGSLLAPMRIRKLSRGVLFASYEFSKVLTNPPLTADDFKPRR